MASGVDGVKELLRKFDELSTIGKEKALRAAVRGAVAPIVKQAKATIPVGTVAHRTYRNVLVSPGFARRSIVAKTFVDRRRGSVAAVVGVRAQAFYAVQFVELERGKSRDKGKPWLRPAFESTEQQQIDAFSKSLMRVINRIRKKR